MDAIFAVQQRCQSFAKNVLLKNMRSTSKFPIFTTDNLVPNIKYFQQKGETKIILYELH
jgi:hypothetical protein